MSQWTNVGKPCPSLSLLFLPVLFGLHILISIFGLFLISIIGKSEQYFLVIFSMIFIICGYFFRNVYLRLFFNLYIWLLKREGKNPPEIVLLRSLKYSIITLIYIPLSLLVLQIILSPNSEELWFLGYFSYFYLWVGITILTAYLVEKYLLPKTLNKVEKAYSQIGGLMARVK